MSENQSPAENNNSTNTAEELQAVSEAGARTPTNRLLAGLIAGLALSWSVFQLFIAFQPIDSHLAYQTTLLCTLGI